MQFLNRELSRLTIPLRVLIEIRAEPVLRMLKWDSDLIRQFLDGEGFKRGCRLCVDGVGGCQRDGRRPRVLPPARELLLSPARQSRCRARCF